MHLLQQINFRGKKKTERVYRIKRTKRTCQPNVVCKPCFQNLVQKTPTLHTHTETKQKILMHN